MKELPVIIMIILTSLSALSGQEVTLNGHEFRTKDGRWYQVDYGRWYRVNSSVITVKFLEVVNPQKIEAFNESKGVQVLRKNMSGFVDLEIPGDADPIRMVQDYQNSNLAEIAHPNTFGRYFGDPSDPKFSNQWFHKQSQDHDIDTPQAWDMETGSPNVIIGVLDSGTDILHEDLEGNIWVNPGEDLDHDGVVWDSDDMNGQDDDGNGKVDDLVGWDFDHGNKDVTGPYYHGTAVAGVAGAVTHNSKGVAGVAGGWGSGAPVVKLMICAVGDYYVDSDDVRAAILYAALNPLPHIKR